MKDMVMKIDDIVAKMKKDSKMKSFADKFKKDAMKSMDIAKSLEKVLPDYVAGKDIQKLMASYNEEDEKKMDKPDSAKEVEMGREDKKKTRIAQLQLQIAKAQETINKLNAQEKPNG
jgi:hypothetical protein